MNTCPRRAIRLAQGIQAVACVASKLVTKLSHVYTFSTSHFQCRSYKIFLYL